MNYIDRNQQGLLDRFVYSNGYLFKRNSGLTENTTWDLEYIGFIDTTNQELLFKDNENTDNIQSVARMIWIYHYGNIKKGYSINWKNGRIQDNRIENLELISDKNCLYIKRNYEKISNKKIKGNITTKLDKFIVYITVDNKTKNVGTFDDIDTAKQELDRILNEEYRTLSVLCE